MGELGGKSVPVLVPVERTTPQHRLWHVCTAHPFIGDGPCGAGCRAFCGTPWRDGHRTVSEDEAPAPDVCLVCDELSEAVLDA